MSSNEKVPQITCDMVYPAFDAMISSTGFQRFEDRAHIDWGHVFEGNINDLRILIPQNILRGSERYIMYWRRVDDVLASVYLSLGLNGRAPRRVNYNIGAQVSHLPSAKILGELTGSYRPFRPLVQLGLLNYFFRQEFSEFARQAIPEHKDLDSASVLLTLDIWRKYNELVLEYYRQGIGKELIPWLRNPEALASEVLEKRLRLHLEEGTDETAIYSMEEIAFLLYRGQFDRARSATAIRLLVDKERALVQNLTPDIIEAERKLHEQADDYFESKVLEYIYRRE